MTAESGHGNKQDRRREAAIAALLTEATVEQAAAKAKVGYRTLKGWLAEPAFQDAYRTARRAVLDRTVTLLLDANAEAVSTLRRNLDCGTAAAENTAAKTVLELTVKGVEALDLAQQLEELRRELAEVKCGNSNANAAGGQDAGGATVPDGCGEPTAGQTPGGPGDDIAAGGDDSRPLAGGPSPLDFPEDAPPMFPAER